MISTCSANQGLTRDWYTKDSRFTVGQSNFLFKIIPSNLANNRATVAKRLIIKYSNKFFRKIKKKIRRWKSGKLKYHLNDKFN